MINNATKLIVFLALCIKLSLCFTYRMFPNENACFYGIVEKPGEKIGFYFAVSILQKMNIFINDYKIIEMLFHCYFKVELFNIYFFKRKKEKELNILFKNTINK